MAQPPPLSSTREIAETDSTGMPNSSSTCARARRAISTGDLAMEAGEELSFELVVALLVELAPLERRRRLAELGTDPARVVELRVRLVDDLREHPGEPARGRERQLQEPADEAHQTGAGSSRDTKLYGGSGPTRRR